MNHYEVLGVEATISAADLRSAYLRLARRYHPDFQHGQQESRSSVADSELRMRQINAAWQVLGNTKDRAAYDQRLRIAAAASSSVNASSTSSSSGAVQAAGAVGPTGPRIEQPSTSFTPYWEHDADDDDSWRYEPDEVNPETVPHKSLLAAPVVTFALGLALLAASAPTGIRALFAAGLICMLCSVFFFGAAPVVAMFKGQIAEERSRRSRSSTRPK
ncbi:MAG: J domain-containing protein [Actinobacteria bacterium]|nr:J domain-containing protein [Actinomycetota bacterium]